MEVRHLNHSCMLVQIGGARILVDPGNFSVEKIKSFGPITGLDAVLITHQHPDHVDPDLLAEILAANPNAIVIAEPEASALITGQTEGDTGNAPTSGYTVVALAPGASHRLGEVTIRGFGGLHAVIHPDIPRVGNTGYVLEALGEPRFGITGDSLEPIEEFRGIEVLAFAVVAPWSKMQETIDFLREVRPQLALPVHDAIASGYGRPIFLRQATNLAPEGTEVRDWPDDDVITVVRRQVPAE
ncbi:MBL fold metallo-hydrolase [Actinomycetaceae bacterium L2_0104]